ncbi:VOC family protein [Streptomyces sp. NPDC008092]|uniref:VOC family protein n=1 Tax=Streptomyces sp. NPDC008092 TaxID=3364808 RepID=UPI0036E31AA1
MVRLRDRAAADAQHGDRSDVAARHERLRARGVEVLKPPTPQPWRRRSLWLRDPEGNVVNLYQDA